jgi:hypothetical protein
VRHRRNKQRQNIVWGAAARVGLLVGAAHMCVPASSLLNLMLPLVIDVDSKICSTMRVVRGTTCSRQHER